ncbi:FHA domain-containing protein [Acinetobacter haemolyticus]|uniref:FHA domain-containing protein n=1 Tax=unclassified Acinetobacter TaxID=196816 RepID=UPI0015D22A85|nr:MULTISPECIES: FHA domain-containing protein [unclassified Acinetobacter]QQN39195.1 FHA domain-containing protein [Acinetobacter sp. CS-2]UDM38490.1 FHA domain-containing protein [Acinetobacter haemolyticus]
MTWKIQAITGELTGQEISIDRDMLVGRHQSADIVLQAGEISRKHAAFLLKDQALWLQDLNSSNGTFVNDVRIEHETLLKEGDIIQFASLKFSVLEPAQAIDVPLEIEQTVAALNQEGPAVKQPVETEVLKTAAQQMNDQGMPELTERDASVQLSRDGMPQGVAIPKPAPIPEGVDLSTIPEKQIPIAVETPVSRVEQVKEEQKNASVGLISIVVLIILAIIAWLFFK